MAVAYEDLETFALPTGTGTWQTVSSGVTVPAGTDYMVAFAVYYDTDSAGIKQMTSPYFRFNSVEGTPIGTASYNWGSGTTYVYAAYWLSPSSSGSLLECQWDASGQNPTLDNNRCLLAMFSGVDQTTPHGNTPVIGMNQNANQSFTLTMTGGAAGDHGVALASGWNGGSEDIEFNRQSQTVRLDATTGSTNYGMGSKDYSAGATVEVYGDEIGYLLLHLKQAAGGGGISQDVLQTSETDLAQAVSSAKSEAVGLNTETDTAQAFVTQREYAVGLTTETDLAQTFSVGTTKLLGIATEADQALSVVSSGQTIAVGIAAETDVAFDAVPSKARPVLQVSETSLAQAVIKSKAKDAGRAEVTDEAFSMAPIKGPTVGLNEEADQALAITRVKTEAVGLVAETNAAQAVVVQQAGTIQLAVETDTVFGVGVSKSAAVGIAAETDLAQSVSSEYNIAVGLNTETDTALAAGVAKSYPIVAAVETDIAFRIEGQGNFGRQKLMLRRRRRK